jgi:hypothetical protein
MNGPGRGLLTGCHSLTVPQSVTDDQFLQCTQCEHIYIGRLKNNGQIVPRGTTRCNHCECDEFDHLTQADLGLE